MVLRNLCQLFCWSFVAITSQNNYWGEPWTSPAWRQWGIVALVNGQHCVTTHSSDPKAGRWYPLSDQREVRMGEGRDKEIQIHRKNKQGSQQCCYKHLPGQLPEQLFQLRHACHVRSTAHPISADQVRGVSARKLKTEVIVLLPVGTLSRQQDQGNECCVGLVKWKKKMNEENII